MNFIKIDQVLPGTCLSVTLCADNYSIDSNKLLTLKDLKILKEAGYTYLFINGKFDLYMNVLKCLMAILMMSVSKRYLNG